MKPYVRADLKTDLRRDT